MPALLQTPTRKENLQPVEGKTSEIVPLFVSKELMQIKLIVSSLARNLRKERVKQLVMMTSILILKNTTSKSKMN